MKLSEMKEFAESQVAWYTKAVEWDCREIEHLSREIKKSRESDRETVEYVMSDEKSSDTLKAIFCKGWESGDTRKLLNERRRRCRSRAYNKSQIERFTKDAKKYAEMIEQHGDF